MNRIDEELVCIDSLAYNLKQHCGFHDVNVQREKNDPPDFWIDLDGQTYAVEVTSIVNEQSYHATCIAFKDTVNKIAVEKAQLKGTYCLRVRRQPNFPHKNSSKWRELCDNAIMFIRDSEFKESADETLLVDEQQGSLAILKVSTTGAAVGLLQAPEAKWEGEIKNDIEELIQEAVTKKRTKLENKGVPARCAGVLLVLYDAYGYGCPDDARTALLNTSGYDWFHSVFWASSFADRKNLLYPDSPGREGTFLYSKINNWLKN